MGIDLSETYLKENAIPRITGALLSRPAIGHLSPRKQQAKIELGGVVLKTVKI